MLIVPSLFVSFSLHAQQAEKTLVKAFNLKGSQTVFLDVDAEVEVKEWGQEQMRVIMTVALENGSEIMLKSLVKVGRYNLDSSEEEAQFKVFAPGLERQVKLRSGKELLEKIHFEVYAPSNVLVKSRNQETVAEKTVPSF